MNFISSLLSNLNYGTILFLMLLESTVVPVPSEFVVTPAAYHAAGGNLDVFLVILFATIGADLGASLNYVVAYYVGRPVIYRFANSKWGKMCLLNQEKVEKSEKYFDDHGIVDKDKNTVNLTVTGAYANENANVDPDSTAKSGKQINYMLELTGNTAGNYTLDSSNTTKGAATETDADTYKGDGAIKRRVAYVDFAAGYGTGIDKEYDGFDKAGDIPNHALADTDKKQREHIQLVGGTGDNTGIIQKDKDNIKLLADSIRAAYAGKGNVARDAQGNVTTQDVYFSNFLLDGDTDNNYVVKARNGSDTLTGSGTVTPRTINVSVQEGPIKEYNRDTAITGKYLNKANINTDKTNVVVGDTVDVFIKSGAYKDWNAGTDKDYTYQLGWTNGNYQLVDNIPDESLTSNGMSAELTGHNGTIEKRLLTVTDVARADKEYDGTAGVKNAADNIVLDDRIIAGDTIGLHVSGMYDNENAAASERTDALLNHDVSYKLRLDNANYQLDTMEIAGKGTIRRKGLTVVATPQSIKVGEEIPVFTGSVNGLLAKDSRLADGFTFAPKATEKISNAVPGSYGVYGWYKGRSSGNLDKNYVFNQSPANDEAFQVDIVDPGREYHDTVNPKGQFRPDMTAYQQSSEDRFGGFNAGARTALEYRDASGAVVGTLTVDGGAALSSGTEFLGKENRSRKENIGIAGAEIVNMDGIDAASTASISVADEGNVVNLEIESILPVDKWEADASMKEEKRDGEIAITQKEHVDEGKDKSESIGVETTSTGVNMAS